VKTLCRVCGSGSTKNILVRPYSSRIRYLETFFKLEYLAVYGRASMGMPVGELQSTMAPTTDYCLSHLYGDWASDTFFVIDRNVTT